jgi:hypothetical protein
MGTVLSVAAGRRGTQSQLLMQIMFPQASSVISPTTWAACLCMYVHMYVCTDIHDHMGCVFMHVCAYVCVH